MPTALLYEVRVLHGNFQARDFDALTCGLSIRPPNTAQLIWPKTVRRCLLRCGTRIAHVFVVIQVLLGKCSYRTPSRSYSTVRRLAEATVLYERTPVLQRRVSQESHSGLLCHSKIHFGLCGD